MNLNNLITDFIIALDESEDINASFHALEKAVAKLGFAGVTYTSMPIGLDFFNINPVFLQSANYNSAFLQHYTDANFAADDFTIKRTLQGETHPINWWSEENKGTITNEERQIIRVARHDYNIANGITIPTISKAHHIAGASVISEEKDSGFNVLLNERLHWLNMVVKLFHHRIHNDLTCCKFFYLPVIEQLSIREQQVLKFAVSGLPFKIIEQYYPIKPSAAANIQSGLFRKFGVKNTSQLAYIAGLHELVTML